MPKVTAIVPNYNHRRFLDQRIASVLAQTYSELDILLLDDASTDGSVEVLNRYRSDGRVSAVIVNDVNTGTPFKQWNKGVAAATGQYVWIAESDDFADPRLVARLVSVLESNPRVGVAYAQSIGVDEDSKELYSLAGWTADLDARHWASDYVNDGIDECRRYLVRKCTIPNASGAVFRRAVYTAVGGASEDYRLSGDWLLWAKMMFAADVAFVAEPLNYFRMHANTVRKRTARGATALLEAIRVFEYIRSRAEIPPDVYDDVCDRLLNRWFEQLTQGRFGVATNTAIYKALKGVDERLNRRLRRRLVRRAGKAVSLFAR